MIRPGLNNSIQSALKIFLTKFENKFPKAYRVYNILKNGSSRFAKETFVFFKIKASLLYDQKAADCLTLKDVEILRQIPRDWKAVAPVMIISAFPFMNWIILPLAYIYPRKLLCSQFWSLEQQLKFGEIELKNRLGYNLKSLEFLSSFIDSRLANVDDKAKNISIDLLERIKKDEYVNLSEIMELKTIFTKPELCLKNISNEHMRTLVNLHKCGRLSNWSNYSNLIYFSYWFIQADRLLAKKDLGKIKPEFIYKLCFERGLNAHSVPMNELIEYLQKWLVFSSKVYSDVPLLKNKDNNYMLLLHGRILLPKTLPINGNR